MNNHMNNQNGPMLMGADGIIRPATAADQAQIQKNMMFINAATIIMSELSSIAYANAINDAKAVKMQKIKNDLEGNYMDEEALNAEAIKIFNSDPKLEVKFDLGMPADVSIAAAQALFQKLGI